MTRDMDTNKDVSLVWCCLNHLRSGDDPRLQQRERGRGSVCMLLLISLCVQCIQMWQLWHWVYVDSKSWERFLNNKHVAQSSFISGLLIWGDLVFFSFSNNLPTPPVWPALLIWIWSGTIRWCNLHIEVIWVCLSSDMIERLSNNKM